MPSRFDPAQWFFVMQTSEDIDVVQLEGGAWFPQEVLVRGRYRNGPPLLMVLGARDGKAQLFSFTVGEPRDGDSPAIAPAAVHDLPLGQILDRTITGIAELIPLMRHAAESNASGGPRWLTADQIADAKAIGASARRGRPVRDETLREVADIVCTYEDIDYREEVRRRMQVSQRTASRWIAAAREKGYLTQEAT